MHRNLEHESVTSRVPPEKSAMIHRWTVKTLGVGALLFCAIGSQTAASVLVNLQQRIAMPTASPQGRRWFEIGLGAGS